jgi:ribonucleotide reductase beta subunit family protein with ferritin-like domain
MIMFLKTEVSKRGNVGFILNDLGRVLSLAHEAIHANLFLTESYDMVADEEIEHNEIAKNKLQILVDILTKYLNDQSEIVLTDMAQKIDLLKWYGVLRTLEGIKFIANYSLSTYLQTQGSLDNATFTSHKTILNKYKDETSLQNYKSIRDIKKTNPSDFDILASYSDKINIDIETIIYSPA